MDGVEQTQAEGKPDSWASPITLADTLEGIGEKVTPIKGNRVAMSSMKIKLHKLDSSKNSSHNNF